MFLLVLAAAVAGGTLLATHVEPRVSLFERLALGAALGVTVQALLAFVLASWFGLTPLVVLVTAAATVVVPYFWTARRGRPSRGRKRRREDDPKLAPPPGRVQWGLVVY